MSPDEIQHIRTSFAMVSANSDESGKIFYQNLFAANPELRPMFKGDMASQSQKLMKMLGVAVASLRSIEMLVPLLQTLARSHVRFGVQSAHYNMVGAALIKMLAGSLGNEFTPQVKAAWVKLYGIISSVMIDAAYGKPASGLAARAA